MSAETLTARCSQCGKSFPTTVKICPDDGTVLEHDHDSSTAALGKVLDGKYRLDDFLSHGGMGAVYKATHVMLGKTVAVKLINPELVTSPDVVRRFQREARAATALNHPNIVAVYDLGQTAEGTLYIAMEFVNGPNLKSVITTGGPVSPIRTVALMRQIASALSAAHRAKIIHRDLKPHNIMIARGEAAEEIVKLVDFGIAKTFDEATQLTMAGDAIGTPHYMAPEQAAGRPVDARSDLYSVGVILYEMLTGDVPFNDSSASAILIKHLQEAPQKPSLKNPNVTIPPDLEAIALKCLEKDPAARFQTADELAAAFERAAATIPGAALAMQAQATLPMGAAAAGPADSWGAPTLPASAAAVSSTPAAAPGAASPTARVQQAPPQGPIKTPPAGSHDTRSTAIPAAMAAAAAPKASKVPLVLVGLFIVVGLAGAGWLRMKQSAAPEQAAPATTTTATSTTPATPGSEPPAASPAMASQSPPTTSAAPQTSQTTPQSEPVAAASSPAKAPSAAPTGSTNQLASAKPPAAAPVAIPPAGTSAPAASASAPAAAPKAPAVAAQAPAAMPPNPAVFFHCTGAPEVCSPLRTAVNDALEKGGLTSVGSPARADIDVTATVEILQEQVSRQFGTTFAVRNYSIDVSGQTIRTSEVVAMPPNATLSFDPQVGSERAAEKARVVAADIVDRVKAFARKKQGG